MGVFVVERFGLDSDPKCDGEGPPTSPMRTISRLVHRTCILDFGSDFELPDPVELVVDYDPELLDLAVSLGVRRLLPQSAC